MNARIISGDRCLWSMTDWASFLQCVESRFDIAEAVGMKSAEAAIMEVKRNEDCFRTNSGVCRIASRPHRVCERFS